MLYCRGLSLALFEQGRGREVSRSLGPFSANLPPSAALRLTQGTHGTCRTRSATAARWTHCLQTLRPWEFLGLTFALRPVPVCYSGQGRRSHQLKPWGTSALPPTICSPPRGRVLLPPQPRGSRGRGTGSLRGEPCLPDQNAAASPDSGRDGRGTPAQSPDCPGCLGDHLAAARAVGAVAGRWWGCAPSHGGLSCPAGHLRLCQGLGAEATVAPGGQLAGGPGWGHDQQHSRGCRHDPLRCGQHATIQSAGGQSWQGPRHRLSTFTSGFYSILMITFIFLMRKQAQTDQVTCMSSPSWASSMGDSPTAW
ncbi:solute carrier family 25 member 34 isoform X2 [Symphalangus syndactylus]|uniref:solute carrier family 25 member 34 isoform X2 n=1 Tax=Symphalangus syndactylus TaxID=9590 RepID=UPI0030073D76